MRNKKPLKIFESNLVPSSPRWYASSAYQQRGESSVVITGVKHDVTDEIKAIIRRRRSNDRQIIGYLLDNGIARGIGEHDMYQCRFCDEQGHNEEVGHPHGIKHKPGCVWLASWNYLN